MDSIYFLLGLFAIAWLALWSARGPKATDRFWWPFDMKQAPDDPQTDSGNATSSGNREGATPPGWRERVTRRDLAALPEIGGARSGTKRHRTQHGG